MSLLSAYGLAILSAIAGGIIVFTYLDYKAWEYARQKRSDSLSGTPIGVELAREMNIEL
jgi:hypothetical protein